MRDKVEEKTKSTKEYLQWHENTPSTDIDMSQLQRHRDFFPMEPLPGVVLLECYAAELMTEVEVANATGILWQVWCAVNVVFTLADSK